MTDPVRVVLALAGASGAAIGVRIGELLAEAGCETHLVVTKAAERTLAHEVGADALGRLEGLVHHRHAIDDVGAAIASGSLATAGMIVAPCSMRVVGAIAATIAGDLLVRAADVHLKERRPLILMPREAPLHLGHLRALTAVTEYGAVVMPPMPAFYLRPTSIEAMIDELARRALALLRLPNTIAPTAWLGDRT